MRKRRFVMNRACFVDDLPLHGQVCWDFRLGWFVVASVPSGRRGGWRGDDYVVPMDGSCAWWVSIERFTFDVVRVRLDGLR